MSVSMINGHMDEEIIDDTEDFNDFDDNEDEEDDDDW